MNIRDRDRRRSGSSDLVTALTFPLRTTKGKLVAYLAWKLIDLAVQEVREADPTVGVPNSTMIKATKAHKGGADDGRA
jgi:hypothetical protein